MADFVLITHTLWTEAPRIRHQVARLIAEAGHRVIFVERADGLLAARSAKARKMETGIEVVRTRRLCHPQLRIVAPLDWFNDAIVARSLRSQLRAVRCSSHPTIINFTHDGAFLRRVFPRQTIVTLIHDDFEAQARLPMFGHVTRNLRSTCAASDRVLAVSTPLVHRLSNWCKPELFLPWSTRPYRAPNLDMADRNILLFWGHVDVGLDTDRIRGMSEYLRTHHPDMQILLVGPTQVASRRAMTVGRLSGLSNVMVRDSQSLDSLPLDRVLAALIPYRRKPDTDAAELPNKTLSLLSCGLPIIKTGLPNMVSAPFILSADTDALFDEAMIACRKNFREWQPDIRGFVESHDSASRLRMLDISPISRDGVTTRS
jgi:hypothetical protein